jgi:hypothetical protein
VGSPTVQTRLHTLLASGESPDQIGSGSFFGERDQSNLQQKEITMPKTAGTPRPEDPHIPYTYDASQRWYVSKEKVKKLDEFINLTIGFFDISSTNTSPRRTHLFRGQRRGDFPLLPKIARADLFDSLEVLKYELFLLQEFRRLAPPLLSGCHVPINDFEWLALARHFGLATRLLDWTHLLHFGSQSLK